MSDSSRPAATRVSCPSCGGSAAPSLSADGVVCLHCAGARALGLASEDFIGVGPSGAPAVSAPGPGVNPPELIGPYEIIEELGRGGMGRVYAARQIGLGRIVALKIIAENSATAGLQLRFLREVQTVAQLRHQGIVAVHDTGRAGGHLYFSMDYIEGGDLARRLRERAYEPREAAILLGKIATALAHAHAAGVLHRDLKPSNILLDGEEPQLADFGLAAQLEAGGDLTAQSGVLGTPHYLAPEAMLRGSAALTVASDIYALGVIAFELLTGRTPFAGASPAALPTLLLNSDPPAPRLLAPAVPRDLETICLKCLDREPARRYASAALLAEDLRHFLAGEPIMAQPPSAFYSFQKFARRHRAAFAAATTVVIVLVAATLVSAGLAVRATRAEKHAALEADAARAVSDFLQNDLLATASPRNEPDRELKVRTILDRAVKKIDGRFADQPLVEAKLRETLYNTYYSLGELALAKPQLERAIELNRQFLGPDDAHALNFAASLAMLHLSLGDHQSAERYAREIRDRQLRVFGPENPDTLTTSSYLAQAIQRAGRHAEATELFRQVLAGRIRTEGADAPDTLDVKILLAESLSSQGKFAECQELQKSVLEAQRRVLGPEHPSTLRSLVSIALTCRSAGQLAESVRIGREVLPIAQRVWGIDAPNTLNATLNLATSLRDNGDWAEAADLYTQVLPALQRTRGLDHPTTLSAMESLATVYRLQLKLAEAEALLRECVSILRRTPKSPPSLANALLLAFASVEQDQGKLTDAEALAREALDLCRRTFGPAHPTTGNAMMMVASILQDQMHYEEALSLYRETTELYRKSLGAAHVSTFASLYNVGYLLQLLGRPGEATPILREVLDGRLRQLGPHHLTTLQARDRLAQTLILQQQFPEAVTLLRLNLDLRRETKIQTWRTFDTESLLGEALDGLGHHDEAEPLLLDAQQKLTALAPTLPWRVRFAPRDAAARLMRFYTALGRNDEAKRWAETAARADSP